MKDYEILYKEGHFVTGKFCNAKVWVVKPEKYPRRDYKTSDLKIGFVVSAKISKSAVKRNRVKRQMREAVRLLLKEDKLNTGFMIAFMAKSNILEREYQEIAVDVTKILKRAKIMS